jgi:hypothetical protein
MIFPFLAGFITPTPKSRYCSKHFANKEKVEGVKRQEENSVFVHPVGLIPVSPLSAADVSAEELILKRKC